MTIVSYEGGSELHIEKPHAYARPIVGKMAQHVADQLSKFRVYRNTPDTIAVQIRVRKEASVQIAGVSLTANETAELIDYLQVLLADLRMVRS